MSPTTESDVRSERDQLLGDLLSECFWSFRLHPSGEGAVFVVYGSMRVAEEDMARVAAATGADPGLPRRGS